MYKALTMHNNVIRKAKYTNAGSTVQQEGDSYTLVFHDAFDAVSFCLQVSDCGMQANVIKASFWGPIPHVCSCHVANHLA